MRACVLLVVGSLLAGCGTLQIGERNIIRADAPGAVAAPGLDVAARFPGAAVREERIATPDGALLRGVSVTPAGATRAVLYFGGNAFHLDQHGEALLPQLASCGTAVVVFDYRGYGRSSGVPTVATLKADALRMYDHVRARYPDGVVVHGQSLGSFMAGHVAQQRPEAGALVLEATATNAQEWVDARVPWYAKLFTSVEVDETLRGIDNAGAVAAYRGPALVLAGERDAITPPQLGRRVFEALPSGDKRWFEVKGAGHNEIFGHRDVRPVYCAVVRGRPAL